MRTGWGQETAEERFSVDFWEPRRLVARLESRNRRKNVGFGNDICDYFVYGEERINMDSLAVFGVLLVFWEPYFKCFHSFRAKKFNDEFQQIFLNSL